MFLDERYFKYGSFNSTTYNLIFAHIDTSEITQITGALTANSMYNRRAKKSYACGYTYSDSSLSLEAEIISENGDAISATDRKTIEKALFQSQTYKKLYAIECNGVQGTTYLNCRLINPEAIMQGTGIVGYKCIIECDSFTAWQDETTVTPTISENTFTITVDSDYTDYIYPMVKLVSGSTAGDIIIKNTTDSNSRETKFSGLGTGTTVNFCGETNYVNPTNLYSKLTSQNFIRLLDGSNSFSITGSVASLEFKWSNRKAIE